MMDETSGGKKNTLLVRKSMLSDSPLPVKNRPLESHRHLEARKTGRRLSTMLDPCALEFASVLHNSRSSPAQPLVDNLQNNIDNVHNLPPQQVAVSELKISEHQTPPLPPAGEGVGEGLEMPWEGIGRGWLGEGLPFPSRKAPSRSRAHSGGPPRPTAAEGPWARGNDNELMGDHFSVESILFAGDEIIRFSFLLYIKHNQLFK